MTPLADIDTSINWHDFQRQLDFGALCFSKQGTHLLRASKPVVDYEVPRKRHHSSTFMVGEPAAYATGSPELKAVGPCLRGFELPDHQVVKEHSAGRAARMKGTKP